MAIKQGWACALSQLLLACLLWQGREKHPQEQDACKGAMAKSASVHFNSLHLQFLLWGRGAPMVALASLCIHFVVVMGACCGLQRRDLVHASGLQAFAGFWL